MSFSHPHQDRPSWLSLPVPNPTKSFWADTPNANPLAREGSSGPIGFGEEDIDVCIIGSGITGISAVYHLQRLFGVQEPGIEKKIVVLEARDFCSGATGRNGGHLAKSGFRNFANRERLYGKSNARKTYALEDYVVSSVVNIIESQGWTDAVDLVNGGHVTVFLEDEEEGIARADYEDAKRGGLGLDDIKFLDRQTMLKTYGINHPGVFNPSTCNLWPLKFVSNLYSFSSSATSTVKIKLHTHTPVTSISPSPDSSATPFAQDTKWVVTTPRGSLSCKTIIHATNAYASHLLPQLKDRIIPTRGQMFAVRAKIPLGRLQRHAWQANWGYEYWFPRPEEKGQGEGKDSKPPLVILGGGRDTAGPGLDQYTMDDGVLNERVSKTLKDFLPNLYLGSGLFDPGKDAEMEWTGIMGFTKDGVPVIGAIEGLPGQYIAAGYTGHGMSRCFAAAEAVSGMITAKLTGREWKAPEWLPEHYVTSWKQ